MPPAADLWVLLPEFWLAALGLVLLGVDLVISDRQQAIIVALSKAKKGNIVLVVGKGHEKTLQIGKEKIPWSEEKAIKKAFKIISSKLP